MANRGKVLSLIMSLCFIISVFFIPIIKVSAAGVTTWDEFVSQFNAVKDTGGNITLTANIIKNSTDTVELKASNLVTITAGYYSVIIAGGSAVLEKIRIDKSSIFAAVTVKSNALLTLNDCYINGQNLCLDIKQGGSTKMAGGAITTAQISGSVGVYVYEGGNFTTDTFNSQTAYIEANGQSSYGVYSDGEFISTDSEIYADGISSHAVWINQPGSLTAEYGRWKAVGSESKGLTTYGTAVFKGGTIEGDGIGAEVVKGKLTLQGGEIASCDDYSVGLKSWDDSEVVIEGGSVFGNGYGINAQGNSFLNIKGGIISVPLSGAFTRTAVELSDNVQADISGTSVISGYQYGVSFSVNTKLSIKGGVIKAQGTAVFGSGELNVYGGILCGYGSGIGVGLYVDGKARVFDGDIRGAKSAVTLSTSSDFVMYQGKLSNNPPPSSGNVEAKMYGMLAVLPYDIEVIGNPFVVVYSAVEWNENIQFYDAHDRYYTPESFEILSPQMVELSMGQNKTVDFTVKGEYLDGSKITLKDILGASGSTSVASYSVSGNSVTFVPTASGNVSVAVDDTVTYNTKQLFSIQVTGTTPPVKYNIILSPTEHGTVVPDKANAQPGELITLTVTPDNGYRVKAGSIKVNSDVISGSTFSMPSHDVTITAEFEPIPPAVTYNVAVSSVKNGKITIIPENAAAGETVSVIVTPDTDYRLKQNSLKCNGVVINDWKFVMPATNVVITAEFELIPNNDQSKNPKTGDNLNIIILLILTSLSLLLAFFVRNKKTD